MFGVSTTVYLILLLLAIPIFFGSNWLLKKCFKIGDKTEIIASLFATLILAPVLYLGIVLLIFFGLTYTPSKDFNRSQWLTDQWKRYQMADSIIDTNMLLGKDTSQVKQILGTPTGSGQFAKLWIYSMGPGRRDFSYHQLKVTLDDNGKVILVEHEKFRY